MHFPQRLAIPLVFLFRQLFLVPLVLVFYQPLLRELELDLVGRQFVLPGLVLVLRQLRVHKRVAHVESQVEALDFLTVAVERRVLLVVDQLRIDAHKFIQKDLDHVWIILVEQNVFVDGQHVLEVLQVLLIKRMQNCIVVRVIFVKVQVLDLVIIDCSPRQWLREVPLGPRRQATGLCKRLLLRLGIGVGGSLFFWRLILLLIIKSIQRILIIIFYSFINRIIELWHYLKGLVILVILICLLLIVMALIIPAIRLWSIGIVLVVDVVLICVILLSVCIIRRGRRINHMHRLVFLFIPFWLL